MSFSLGWLASHGVLSTYLQHKLIAIATGGGYEIITVAQYILQLILWSYHLILHLYIHLHVSIVKHFIYSV